ncbi:Reticulon domain-containing protein [Cephalotus follicularis]|uniref:Reticulon-like protein n=1 Tax=Cephalotus follicularis TaxID=3775 RepID=A0A1Q3CSU5_CEPFO|nr:Reticulon domain-containing protein [Cephalotus follicularis]
MDVSRRRSGARNDVVAGSVWESRMKSDEVKGGIKVFNGEETNIEENSEISNNKKSLFKRGQTVGGVAISGKRKTWKSESFDKNPIQITKGKSNLNFEEQCKELNDSLDGIKRSPIQAKKGRSEVTNKEVGVSVDGIDRTAVQVKKGRSEGSNKELTLSVVGNDKSPIKLRKSRSGAKKESNELCKEVVVSSEGVGRNPVQLRSAKSDPVEVLCQSGKGVPVSEIGNERNSVTLRKAKSESNKGLDNSVKCSEDSVDRFEKTPVEIDNSGSEETCKEFGVCQEMVISSSTTNEGIVKSAPKVLFNDEDISDGDGDDTDYDDGDEEFEDEEVEVEIEKKEINVPEPKPSQLVNEVKQPSKAVSEGKQTIKVVKGVNKFHQFNDRTARTSSTLNKQPPPVVKRATIYQNIHTKPTPVPVSDEYQSFPATQNKLHNLVDLVMWRDISRSAFVFGIGTFIIISSTYTQDLNISFISVISYLGLAYLAAIFLYRSLICRGSSNIDDTSFVFGEEEAVWLLKLVLPYLNEFLLKLRELFSGDPATTMKLAVLLFVLARCGSSITIWKMAKLGFFGVFTVPKVCSSYSSQLAAYGKFWIKRFHDAWESCSHKKAVAGFGFTLVWNLSSVEARIWAVFVLFVAVRYYQQTLVRDDWVEEEGEEENQETLSGGPIRGQKQGRGPTFVAANKVKKGS